MVQEGHERTNVDTTISRRTTVTSINARCRQKEDTDKYVKGTWITWFRIDWRVWWVWVCCVFPGCTDRFD